MPSRGNNGLISDFLAMEPLGQRMPAEDVGSTMAL